MRRMNAIAAVMTVVIGRIGRSGARRRHGVRGRAAHRRRRQASIENATLVMDGRRSSRPAQGVTVPAGAKRVNLTGKTVMPTMIDTHVHLSAHARQADPRPEAARLLGRQRRA